MGLEKDKLSSALTLLIGNSDDYNISSNFFCFLHELSSLPHYKSSYNNINKLYLAFVSTLLIDDFCVYVLNRLSSINKLNYSDNTNHIKHYIMNFLQKFSSEESYNLAHFLLGFSMNFEQIVLSNKVIGLLIDILDFSLDEISSSIYSKDFDFAFSIWSLFEIICNSKILIKAFSKTLVFYDSFLQRHINTISEFLIHDIRFQSLKAKLLHMEFIIGYFNCN